MRILATLLLLLFTPLAAIAQQDDSDRGFIQGLLEDALSAPGRTVRVEGFAGALSSRATIDRVTVTDSQGVWLTATDLALVWSRTSLLAGQIDIDEITVGKIDMPRMPEPGPDTAPSPEAAGAFALPDLPVSVDIARMQIGSVSLGASVLGQAAQVTVTGQASLASGTGNAALDVKRLDRDGRFALSGGFDNITRHLKLALSLDEPAGGIAAGLLDLPGSPSVALSVEGDDPIADFETRIRLATESQDRLNGRVTLVTDEVGATRFGADLSGDLTPVLAPDMAQFLGDKLRLEARGLRREDGDLALDALTLRTRALRIDGIAEIGADGWPRKLSLDTLIETPDGQAATLPIPGQKVMVQGGRIAAHFDAEKGDAWKLEGVLDGFAQDGLAADKISITGEGAILREAESISGQLSLDLAGPEARDPGLARVLEGGLRGMLQFGWKKGTPLRLHGIDLAGADYGLTGVVAIDGLDGASDLAIVPDVRLIATNMPRFAPMAGIELAGRADLSINGKVEPLTGLMNVRLDGTTQGIAIGNDRLDPLLAGSGTLTVGVERDMAGLRVSPLDIRTDLTTITGTADMRTGASAVDLSMRVAELAGVEPALVGAGAFTLKARQTGDEWAVETDVDLPGEARASYRGTISGDGKTSLAANGLFKVSVGDLSLYSALVGRPLTGTLSLRAEGRGDLLTHVFDLTLSADGKNMRSGMPSIAPLVDGRLQVSVSARRDAGGEVEIRDAKLESSGMAAAISGRFGPQTGAVDYKLNIHDLGRIVEDFPGAASLTGKAERQGDGWRIDASGQGPAGVTIGAIGTIAGDVSRVDLKLAGSVPLAVANARLKGQALAGLMRFDLSVNGPPALHSVSGRITVGDGRVVVPAQNLALNNIVAQADLAGGAARLSLSGDVSSGGKIRVEGPVSLSAPYNGNLTAQLYNVTLRKKALYEVDLNGQVNIDGPLTGGARIKGAIDILSAELRLPNLGPSYSALEGLRHLNPSADVSRTLRYAGLDRTPEEVAASIGYPLDLILRVPNRLFVRGRGLDAELGGELRLAGSTNDVIPMGELDLIRGRLDLLGRRLLLTEGALRMRGSFDPVIAFAATATVDDVDITLRLDGVASAPDLTVTSVPELPQEEALSYFLFGRDVTTISAFQAVQLASAIRTLSGRGGRGVVEKLRQNLGVDDFDIGTDSEGESQAKVGRYLTENIYSDVTIKGDGTSQINLNLEATDHIVVRGRLGSDGDTGLGAFFEKDY